MADDTKAMPKMQLIHGMQWFPGTTQEMIDTLPRLLARENDIFVSTYAKAGKYNNNVPASPRSRTSGPKTKNDPVDARAHFFVSFRITTLFPGSLSPASLEPQVRQMRESLGMRLVVWCKFSLYVLGKAHTTAGELAERQ